MGPATESGVMRPSTEATGFWASTEAASRRQERRVRVGFMVGILGRGAPRVEGAVLA
jgi:hypothetical protein